MKTWKLLPLAASCLCACFDPELPSDFACENLIEGGANGAALREALASAKAGDCVVPTASFYRGSFVVPPGVSLVAEVGAEVAIQGDVAGEPAVKLNGGERSAVMGIHIRSSPSTGLLIQGAPALVANCTIENAAGTGILAACLDAACAQSPITIKDTEVRASSIGLWAYAAQVKVQGGRCADNRSQNLGGGYGVVASHGATLEMDGTVVQNNQEVGVLLDDTTGGAAKTGTKARLANLNVSDNLGRGIWAQGLSGTSTDPKLTIEGAATLVSNNRIVGIGARDSKGIIIINGKVEKTVAVVIPTGSLGKTESVGDGVGVFEGTGSIKLDGVEMASNQRSQVLVDHGERGIIIINGKVSKEGGKYSIVVQNTEAAEVQAPAEQVEQVTENLAVSASAMPVAGEQH